MCLAKVGWSFLGSEGTNRGAGEKKEEEARHTKRVCLNPLTTLLSVVSPVAPHPDRGQR